MTDMAFHLILVVLAVFCTTCLLLTALLALAVRDLRRILHHLDALLPDCRRALRDSRRVLLRTDRVVRAAAGIVVTVHDGIEDVAHSFRTVKDRALATWPGRWMTGVGSGSHRSNGHHRVR